MRASTTCILKRDNQVVLRGEADLQSGPRGWRITVYAGHDFDIESLPEGRYELTLPLAQHTVRLGGMRVVTREVRFVGIGPLPAELTPPGSRRSAPRHNPDRRRA